MRQMPWHDRPVAAVCLVVACLAWFFLSLGKLSDAASFGSETYSISIRMDGTDPKSIVRDITVALEDAIAEVGCVMGMASVSEYGQCRLFARIRPGTDPASAYNELSSAAFAAYDSMPDAAQRPEIRRGGEDEGPVWIAAFETGAELTADSAPIKRVIAALERLDGVARVDSSGQGSMETLISYDAARAASVGLDAGNIAFSLAADDLLAPGGRVHADGRALALLIDGRFPSAFELESAPIPLPHGSFVCLGEIASIRERAKEPDRISRVNGKGMTTVAVMPSGARSVIALSRAIAGAMHMLKETPGLEMTVLSDDGAEAGKELSRILRAAFFGMAAVALLSGALVAGSRGAFSEPARIMAMASVPFTVLVAAAIVCMSGKNADSYAIAGLAAGLGSAVDAAILSAESMGRAEHKVEALAAFRALRPALLAGCATNVAALLPLRGFETLSPGIVTVALAMGAVNIASLFSSLAIMPPLVLSEGGRRKRKLSCMRRARPRPVGIALRRARRGMAFFSDLCCRFPLWVAALAFALSLAGALALFSMPLSADQDSAGPGVFVHAEFESGTAIGPADQRLAAYARSLLETGSAELVYTSARRGGGSLYAVPVRGNRESLVAAIDSARLEGGLAWLESAGAGKFDWQLVVSGDDDGVCRRIAEDAARLLGNGVSGYDVVLNFKNDHGSAVFRFDAEKAAAAGVPFSRAAAAIRSTVHGPVAYKRSAAGREGDVRVLAVGDSSKEPGAATWADALSVLVRTDDGFNKLTTLSSLDVEDDPGSLFRKDRRSAAGFTLRNTESDPFRARSKALEILRHLELPTGYSLEFDRDAIAVAEELKAARRGFLFVLFIVYMCLAALEESLTVPLAALLPLLPSMAVPALALAIRGSSFDPAYACAFVAVSGMAVNASVLVHDSCSTAYAKRQRGSSRGLSPHSAYRALRQRAPALAATSATTVAGSLPFLISGGPGLAGSLAFVSALGVGASFISAIALTPALSALFPLLMGARPISDTPSRDGCPVL